MMKPMFTQHTAVFKGRLAEEYACHYLEKQNLQCIEKNFVVKGGEIDLIMRDQKYLVFVEVKLRTNLNQGSAIEMITPQKKSRLKHAATIYLLRHYQYHEAFCRFDVIAIDHPVESSKPQITWIKNAFGT